MSNPNELPGVIAKIKALTCAAHPAGYTAKEARMFNLGFYAGTGSAAEVARRAQPKGEAPQPDTIYQVATKQGFAWCDVYKEVYDDCPSQTNFNRRIVYARPAATLSPLCGGKEADAAEKAAAYDELNRIAELHGFASAAAAIAAARRAAQQAAAPADCSGTPSSCPDNEGYGCHCSAPGTPEAPKPPFPISDDEMTALRRFWECATDGEGYDVEKAMMQRLAEMGLVQRKSGAYYMATEFGLYVLGEYTVERAAQLDGGQEGSV